MQYVVLYIKQLYHQDDLGERYEDQNCYLSFNDDDELKDWIESNQSQNSLTKIKNYKVYKIQPVEVEIIYNLIVKDS